MKNFEEWFWTEYDPHDDSYDVNTIIKTKTAWKAALKWVLQKEHIAKFNDGERFVFIDFIERELGE